MTQPLFQNFKDGPIPSSFRDPSGFLFVQNGILYRQINSCYSEHYEHAEHSGLFNHLIGEGLLIPHQESLPKQAIMPDAWKIIKPEPIKFISYPYEWCFGQLKSAALMTLTVQKKSLEHGMTLKDASAYNIQFKDGKTIFIDSLSFEIYREGKPWGAYRQFCEQFLAPLALMSCRDLRLNGLFLAHPGGIPLDLASKLLPGYSWFQPGLFLNLHLQARTQFKTMRNPENTAGNLLNKSSLLRLIDHLESTVLKLNFRSQKSQWADYKTHESYSPESLASKQKIVSELLSLTPGSRLWDLGSNTGLFSEEAAKKADFVLAVDSDPVAGEAHWNRISKNNSKNILPLIIDIAHPSPSLGWENKDLLSLEERGPADTVMALAVLHHITITHNVPFERLANFLGRLCHSLIIEFIPKWDPKVRELLSRRVDIFPGFTTDGFEKAFLRFFKLCERRPIDGSSRILYLFRKN